MFTWKGNLKVFTVISILAVQIVGPGGRKLLDWFKEIKIKISAAATSERILIAHQSHY
jgi:hypothetical protein